MSGIKMLANFHMTIKALVIKNACLKLLCPYCYLTSTDNGLLYVSKTFVGLRWPVLYLLDGHCSKEKRSKTTRVVNQAKLISLLKTFIVITLFHCNKHIF